MPATVNPGLMTSELLFKMRPSKMVDRWIFRGELRESRMTKRNPSHSHTVVTIGALFHQWLKSQKQPRGKAYAGECYFRIRRDPETNVGIDIAIATPEQAAATSKKDSFVDGPPLLAVEVLSPYDKSKDIHEMIEEYLDCGIAAVWIVDPYAETVAIHRRDREPQLLTRSAAIDQQPELPGFTCTVAELFQ